MLNSRQFVPSFLFVISKKITFLCFNYFMNCVFFSLGSNSKFTEVMIDLILLYVDLLVPSLRILFNNQFIILLVLNKTKKKKNNTF